MQRLFSEVALQLNPTDNVAIAKEPLEPDTVIALPHHGGMTIRETIPMGHKFALQTISPNRPILRYGYPIGIAAHAVEPGDWVHTHNLVVGSTYRDYEYKIVEPVKTQPAQTYFQGLARADGRVGTRNYIAVIATVNCSSHVAVEIARAFTPEHLARYPNIDGVIPLVHSTGCSFNPNDLAHRYLRRTLANIARNPNIGGFIFVSLGCEGNQIDGFCDLSLINPRIETLNPYPTSGTGVVVQDQGGFRKTVAAGIAGIAAIEKILPQSTQTRRAPVSVATFCIWRKYLIHRPANSSRQV